MNVRHFFSLALTAATVPSSALAGGVPQLDPTWYPSQLFWMIISFALMLILVRGFITPKLNVILTHRKESIQTAVREAEEYRAKAAKADQDMSGLILEARSKASALLSGIQKEVNKLEVNALGETSQILNGKLKAAEARIQAASHSALVELQSEAADLTKAIVEKLLGSSVDKADALTIAKKVS